MTKIRLYVKPEQIKGKNICIKGEDFHYLTHVLRLRKSDVFYVFDGVHKDMKAKIIEIKKNCLDAEVLHELCEGLPLKGQPHFFVDIAQSLPKKDKMDLIVEKCTELGARNILPFISERTIPKLNIDKGKKRVQRWQKIATSSSRQSMRDFVPQVSSLLSLKELKNKFDNYDLVIIPWEEEKKLTLKKVLNGSRPRLVGAWIQRGLKSATTILVVIGPEGGFSKSEIRLLEHNRAKTVSLGKRILRTETVALMILSIINYEYE